MGTSRGRSAADEDVARNEESRPPMPPGCWDEPGANMRADARRSRAKLLEAATTAFAEHGADAPLDDIARRAGVGIGTLYRHFPTRTDLQAAVYRSQVFAVCEAADELVATVPPEQAFFGWVRAMAGYLATKRGLSRALIEAVGKDSELISGCWVAMRDSTDRLLAHAQRAGVLRERHLRPRRAPPGARDHDRDRDVAGRRRPAAGAGARRAAPAGEKSRPGSSRTDRSAARAERLGLHRGSRLTHGIRAVEVSG